MKEPFRGRKHLKLLMLYVLKDRPKHAYGIIKEFEEVIGVRPSPGAVYPVIKSLMKDSLISVEEIPYQDRVVKMYKVTDKGSQYLKEHSEEVEECLKRAKAFKVINEVGGYRLFMLMRDLTSRADKLSEQQREELRKAILDFEIKVLNILKGVSNG